jgi:hypothetical protein
MATLHTRDMVPPVRELVPEMTEEVTEVSEPTYRRDGATGVLLETGNIVTQRVVTLVPVHVKDHKGKVKLDAAGEPVPSMLDHAIREDGTRVDGSLIAVDLVCHDCGTALIGAGDRLFEYLVCGRIDSRDHVFVRVRYEDHDHNLVDLWEKFDSDEPYEGCVLECGKAGL